MTNKFLKSISFFLLLFQVSCSSTLSAKVEFYVSTTGNDQHEGTKERPFASLERARNAAREKNKQSAVEIILREGTYYLPAPLALEQKDSGSLNAPITWRAADNEKVVISGGRLISGVWIPEKDGIWSIPLQVNKDKWHFRQLFVDGQRAIRARFPNANQANPFLYALDGGMDHVIIDPKLVKASWGKETDVQINMVPNWRFFNQWNTLSSIDLAKGRLDFTDSERHAKVIKGSWFWLEGVKEELDSEQEWYLDRQNERLYYKPKVGVDPNTLQFIAPKLNVLIDMKGDVENKTHVQHVVFRNLIFRHTTFSLGHIEARVHTDAALRLENASHCRIEHCRVENIGGYAFWLHLDSRHNVINRNTIVDSGGGGVLLTGARLSYMDETKLLTPGKVAATVFPILNSITRNTVEHCGKIRYYGGGVHLDSRPFSMSMEPGNYIAHNYFNDLSRNGIFAFRNQGGNVIEYNHIHNAMQTTIDGACIHIATMNHLNAPNYILNNWLYDIWGYEQKPDGIPKRYLANGIFLDWDSSNTILRDNYIYNAGGEAVKVIWENWNVEKTGNKISSERVVPPFVADLGPDGVASNKIDLENNRLIGRVIHYSESELFSSTGQWKPQESTGLGGLFKFSYLTGTSANPAQATYTLPITEDGTYQISLLYKPSKNAATNVPITINHANGSDKILWDMQKGSKHGFAVEFGKFKFKANQKYSVIIETANTNGIVIVDGLAFVKEK